MITPETMLIVAGAAFLLFGGKKLPELGRSLGHGIREFRSGTQGLKDELEGTLKSEQTVAAPAPLPTVSVARAQADSPVVLPSNPVTHVIQLGEPVSSASAERSERRS